MQSPTEINLRRVLVGHRAAVNVVDFDDRYIVSASGDRTIKVSFFVVDLILNSRVVLLLPAFVTQFVVIYAVFKENIKVHVTLKPLHQCCHHNL